MDSKTKYLQGRRIPELDFLRGLAIVLMMGHHTIYDLRHIFGLNILAFQDTVWFMDWIRPVILLLFLTVSGVSSTFSRDNFKRGLRLLAFAISFSLAMELVSYFGQMEMHVYFNVFHLLALGILFYSLVTRGEKKQTQREGKDWRSLLLLVLGIIFLYLGSAVAKSPYLEHDYLMFIGLYSRDLPGMADYLPLFPWFGMFLIGAAIGRLFYRDRQSLLPQGWTKPLTLWGRPLLFLGRHPLTVYVVHQPLLLLLIWLILKGLRLA